MKKFLLLAVAVMASVLLCVPTAHAAPSPTETGPTDPYVPPAYDPADGPTDDLANDPADEPGEDLVEIDEMEVPLADLPAPQTGVTGLTGMEALTLTAAAFVMSGTWVLVKARKQTNSAR